MTIPGTMEFILSSWVVFLLIVWVSPAQSGTLGRLLYKYKKLSYNHLACCLPDKFEPSYSHLAYVRKLSLAKLGHLIDIDKNIHHDS